MPESTLPKQGESAGSSSVKKHGGNEYQVKLAHSFCTYKNIIR